MLAITLCQIKDIIKHGTLIYTVQCEVTFETPLYMKLGVTDPTTDINMRNFLMYDPHQPGIMNENS